MSFLDRLAGEATHQRAEAASRPKPHLYQTCRDESCGRPACRAYKAGVEDGYALGYAAGLADGARA